jgi:ketosteroid isomerase-like protein
MNEIEQLEDQRYDAMLAKDVETLDKLYDPQLVYTHSSGTVDTKDSYIKGVREQLWDYKAIERTEQSVLLRSDHALVFNRVRMDIHIAGTPKKLDNRVVAVWSKTPDRGWQFLSLHSTPNTAT